MTNEYVHASWRERAERAEAAVLGLTAERDRLRTDFEVIAKRQHEATRAWQGADAMLDKANRKILELRAALEAVEWVHNQAAWDGSLRTKCPWCYWWKEGGHAPDCSRQRALGNQKGEGPERG